MHKTKILKHNHGSVVFRLAERHEWLNFGRPEARSTAFSGCPAPATDTTRVVLISREIGLEMREILDSDAWPVSQPRWAVRSQATAAPAPHAFMSWPHAPGCPAPAPAPGGSTPLRRALAAGAVRNGSASPSAQWRVIERLVDGSVLLAGTASEGRRWAHGLGRPSRPPSCGSPVEILWCGDEGTRSSALEDSTSEIGRAHV